MASELNTKMGSTILTTKIGLEIHVQLATKSKMFCRCDNNAEGKAPNTVVCPVCLGLPGALPVTNKKAVLWTIKTGLALNCEIPKIAKFDRKHYFYPDLPKGYQISQYDEPFCVGGYLETDGAKIRLNRIHLEEDAGKLIHSDGKSLVDLNRAGTPLMEIVTEPDITSPKQAGDFLRKLQKIVRDVVKVSEASMEKGHLRCDANISVRDGNGKMSSIVELKNINSFRFVEKALTLVDIKLKEEYAEWPEKNTKETWGYDSKADKVYLQRRKEEAADYRYFPEPDLPPFDSNRLDLEVLSSEIGKDESAKIQELVSINISEANARVIVNDSKKYEIFDKLSNCIDDQYSPVLATAIVNNYFGFDFGKDDFGMSEEYAKAVKAIRDGGLSKPNFSKVVDLIHKQSFTYDKALEELNIEESSEDELEEIVEKVLADNQKEVDLYKAGKVQLLGYFMGQAMKYSEGKANPQVVSDIIRRKLA